MTNLSQNLVASAARRPDSVALRCDDQTYTYAQFDTAAARVVKATGPSLAWSEDSDGGGDLLPYTGEDVFGDTTTTRAIAQYVPPAGVVAPEPSKAWQRLPLVVFGVAIFAVIAAVGGVTIALTGTHNGKKIFGRAVATAKLA